MKGPRSDPRDERGSASVELVVLMPLLLLILFAGVQGAVYYHARTLAIAAAQEGARAAARENGTLAAGTAAATAFLADAAGDSLTAVTITGTRTADHRHHHRARVQPEPRPRLDPHRRTVRQPARRTAHLMPRPPEGPPAMARPTRDERGSATVEAVIGVPAFLLLIALLVLGGRIAIAHQVVQAAASDAARAASIARTAASARSGRHHRRPAQPRQPGPRLRHHHRHRRHQPRSAPRSGPPGRCTPP